MQISISSYIQILDEFLSGLVDARQFEQDFLRLFASDEKTDLPTEASEALESLFGAVDAYCGDPSLRTQLSHFVDDEGLLEAARTAAMRLRPFAR